MVSVNTNAAAITALRTLQNTNQQLDSTQARISTGLKIGEAKDNAAYWAISTTLKSDNKSLSTVKDALGLGASTVDTAYQGLNMARDVLDEIKSKLTAATQDGLNRNTIQDEIKQLQDQLKSIATSSVFSGENWLSVDSSASSYTGNKTVVSSFSRDASGAVSIGNITIDTTNVALFDNSSVAGAGGILNKANSLVGSDGRNLAIGGTSIDTKGNTATGGVGNTSGTVSGSMNTAGTATSNLQGVAATSSVTAVGNVASGAIELGTVAAGALSALASGDMLTFSFKLNGNDQTINFNKSDIGSSDADGLKNAINAALLSKGLNSSIVASVTSSNKITFDLTGGAPTDTFQLNDLVVTNAAGKPKNPASGPIFGTGSSFVASTVGSYVTNTLNWTSITNKTAQLTMTVDGVKKTVEVNTGANAAAFANNLNNSSSFTTNARVTEDANALTFLSTTTGANSKVVFDSIVFKNADGTVFSPGTATEFDNVGGVATTTTSTFSTLSLDANDKIQFGIQVDSATKATTVTIDKALIDKTLGATANGNVTNTADYKKVFDAALSAAGVKTLKTTANATTLDIATTVTGGNDAKITITKSGASAGGAQIAVNEIDISDKKLGDLSSDDLKSVLKAYITVVNSAIEKVKDGAASLGSVASRIDMQRSFVDNLMDTIDKGVGNLIDADMSEESTKLQALQVKQSLGVQALSIANQSAQSVLQLFR